LQEFNKIGFEGISLQEKHLKYENKNFFVKVEEEFSFDKENIFNFF
jgi:hypothetical protein